MKRRLLKFTTMVALMLAAGMGLKAQQITITLLPGWTWISYPRADTLDFSTALGTFTPVEGDMIKSQFGFSEYHDGYWTGSISQFCPGLGYMYYSARTMPALLVFGSSIPPQAEVTVTTSEPMLVTAISAMGGGEVTVNDGTYILVKGLCWATHENPTTNEDFYQESESGVGSFSISMTDLNISTTYYVRAYAVTPNGTVYGDQKTFTTRDGIPTLTTTEVTNITGATATCGGNITDNGGLNVTARGVCWSTSPNPTVADSHTTNGSGMGSFSSSIIGLNVSITYYVRAYATTAVGIAYGEEKTFTTRDGVAVVTTAELTEIGLTTATCGGIVTDDGGLTVTARGVCWSTESNPTIADLHCTNGSGTGSFSSGLTSLMPNTIYYVRAYATNSLMTVYGSELSFTTGNPTYVDLGLPSGLLWATCNVGAESPEEYGDYFAWGETTTKDTYNWSTYQYCNGSYNTLTKYCTDSYYGYNGFTDNLTTLLPEDDAATANWGSDWRMPTKEEWQELYNNTTCTWTTQDGVNGRLFTASNGNSIFLPAAGERWNSELDFAGSGGLYWSSSSLDTEYLYDAWRLYFGSGNYGMNSLDRSVGQSVRPVRSSGQNNVPTGAINGKFTINEDGDQVYFSQGNLQYQASTNTWRFAEHQWDCVGADNENASSTYDGWIDRFGWGTSGYDHGAVCYQPWCNCSIEDYLAYGNDAYSLFDSTGMADWGYNAISNGGNMENLGWRTLKGNEWSFLFGNRPVASGIRFAKATVDGKYGMILVPDDWNADTYPLNNVNTGEAHYDSNIIGSETWTNVFEANGAVFLPQSNQASDVRYSSSSKSYPGQIWILFFGNEFFTAHVSTWHSGKEYAVRLVQDVNP